MTSVSTHDRINISKMSSGCCLSIHRSSLSDKARGDQLSVGLPGWCVDFLMTVFPKHALTQGSQLLAALFPQFSTETSWMPCIASREGNDASARLKGWEMHYTWEMHYIWETCWHIENVSMAKTPMCCSRPWESHSLCLAHLLTSPSLLGVLGSKNNAGLLEHVMYHWCDALMGTLKPSWGL